MIEEVSRELFRLEMPLPRNPLRAVNTYVLRASVRSCIVDPGLDMPECMAALQAALGRLGVDPGRSDLFLTHLHADHSGLAAKIASEDRCVYIGGADGAFLSRWRGWGEVVGLSVAQGIPQGMMDDGVRDEELFSYRVDNPHSYRHVADGELLELGGRVLTAVATPGHTQGHTCLYDRESGEFFSGDHVLQEISPIITGWDEEIRDPLADYLASLDKVAAMEIRRVLPGHRAVFTGYRERISQIKLRHELRLEEALALLVPGGITAYEAASAMTWDLKGGGFFGWPLAQRWFATGEALAHLRHLVNRGLAQSGVSPDGVIRFRPVGR